MLQLPGLVILRDAAGRWLRFDRPLAVVETSRLDEVVACLRQVEARTETDGLHAAGFVSYEAAPAMDSALPVRPPQGVPLVWFGLYDRPKVIEFPGPGTDHRPPGTGSLFGQLDLATTANVHSRKMCLSPYGRDWSPSVGREDYEAAIGRIKECIARGETYQVNYTFRLNRPMTGDPWPLFVELVEAQRPEYPAYIDTPRLTVCSASPELFFRLSDGQIVTCPMKGTAARGRSWEDDLAQARRLAASEKNRAENAMIVDMMRNDLGRIARRGSVRVEDLFRVERYPTLWQMTSTVAASTTACVSEVFRALFPCASVTGAPKPSTMGIIAQLETRPRGLYTGAIGMIAPGRRAQFNVAIRTLVVDKSNGQAEYGVGGGVVWDSTPTGEYEECLLKARILDHRPPRFSLLETLLWTPGQGYFLLDRHLCRLTESAEYFGYPMSQEEVSRQLDELAAGLPSQAHRVRMLVARDGQITSEATPVAAASWPEPVRLRIAQRSVDSGDPFLYHKTTHREIYAEARRGCEDCDDVVLHNQRGEVTETTISNLVVRLGGQLWTPPVETGLLPGTFRGWLLDQGIIRQRVISLRTLAHCEEVYVVNSVRKWQRAVISRQ